MGEKGREDSAREKEKLEDNMNNNIKAKIYHIKIHCLRNISSVTKKVIKFRVKNFSFSLCARLRHELNEQRVI